LFIEVYNELPSIKTTYNSVDSVPIPHIYFAHNYNFTILCTMQNLNNDSEGYRECSESIIAPKYNPNNILSYSGAFLSDYVVNSDTGPTLFDLDIFIIDPIFAMVMSALDSEYDNNLQDLAGTPTPFENSNFIKNQYYIGQPQNDRITYLWSFSRTIRNIIIPNILSYFGSPRYIRMPYIESNMQLVPFTATIFNDITNRKNASISIA
ncbi:36449_t:CDS:2, partial [Racocetra persica]